MFRHIFSAQLAQFIFFDLRETSNISIKKSFINPLLFHAIFNIDSHKLMTMSNDTFFYNIFVQIIADGKYHLLPSGELLIHNLEYNDRYASYRCRTMHKLTRQVVISNSAKIRINGKLCYKLYFHLFFYFDKN